MSAQMIQVSIVLAKGPAPAGTPVVASTSVVVTDSSGTAQPAVVLTGVESPTPWGFTTSVAVGAGTVVATDLDATGATVGTPVSQAFTEMGSPPASSITTGITVTPV